MGVLINTGVWIDVEAGRLAPADVATVTGDDPVFLSPVTIAELRFGVDAAPDAAVRQQRMAALRRLLRKPCLTIDEVTGEVFGSLASELRAARHGHRRRTQDVWLAAQAVQHGYRLLTRNASDFADIPGLALVVI